MSRYSLLQISVGDEPVSRHKLHDFIHSFSHANNKSAGDLCKSTLVDDDSYDDR